MEQRPLTFVVANLPPARRRYVAQFLRAWLAWADAGGNVAPGAPFRKSEGLCTASCRWDAMMKPCDPMSPEVRQLDIAFKAVGEELLWQYKNGEIPSRNYPFNKDGDVSGYFGFKAECAAERAHLNPARIHWAHSYLESLEAAQ